MFCFFRGKLSIFPLDDEYDADCEFFKTGLMALKKFPFLPSFLLFLSWKDVAFFFQRIFVFLLIETSCGFYGFVVVFVVFLYVVAAVYYMD